MSTFAALLLASGLSLPQEKHCLVEAIYFEARGEPLEGQMFVANVVKNRVLSEHWPDSVCGVVEQPYQFSYKTGDTTMKEEEARERAYKAAQEVLENPPTMAQGGVVFFHSASVRPSWDYSQLSEGKPVGNHIFYSLER